MIGKYRQLTARLSATEEDPRLNGRSGIESTRGESPVKIEALEIIPDESWSEEGQACPESGVTVLIVAKVRKLSAVRFFVRATSPDGFPYFTIHSDPVYIPESGLIKCKSRIQHLMLMPGDYVLWGGVCKSDVTDYMLAEGNATIVVATPKNESRNSKASLYWNRAEWQNLE